MKLSLEHTLKIQFGYTIIDQVVKPREFDLHLQLRMSTYNMVFEGHCDIINLIVSGNNKKNLNSARVYEIVSSSFPIINHCFNRR